MSLYPGKPFHYEYEVIKLWELDPEPALAMESPGLWPFVPLMRGQPLELLRRSRRKILDLDDKIVTIEAKQQLLTILGGLSWRVIKDWDLLQQLLTELGNMSDNPFLDALFEQRRAAVLQKGREEGLRQGLEEGRKEGRKG